MSSLDDKVKDAPVVIRDPPIYAKLVYIPNQYKDPVKDKLAYDLDQQNKRLGYSPPDQIL